MLGPSAVAVMIFLLLCTTLEDRIHVPMLLILVSLQLVALLIAVLVDQQAMTARGSYMVPQTPKVRKDGTA